MLAPLPAGVVELSCLEEMESPSCVHRVLRPVPRLVLLEGTGSNAQAPSPSGGNDENIKGAWAHAGKPPSPAWLQLLAIHPEAPREACLSDWDLALAALGMLAGSCFFQCLAGAGGSLPAAPQGLAVQ